MGGRATQFGIEEQLLPNVMEQIQTLEHVQVEGFHFHSISNHLDAVAHLNLIEYYFSLAGQWAKEYGLQLGYLNAGGGIGVNYSDLEAQFEWHVFREGLASLLRNMSVQAPTLVLECGRYVTASSGYYAAEVLDIKRNHGTNYVVVRGGTHHFRLPASWHHSHPFEVITLDDWHYEYERPTLEQSSIHIVGQLCTPKDVLAQQIHIDKVCVGDIVLFQYTGAYGWAISHHDFLSHPHPLHLFLDNKDQIQSLEEKQCQCR
ncbi:L-glutamyl-[BtrI acyl-carrier protein] decarboxylase [compost metagenome]